MVIMSFNGLAVYTSKQFNIMLPKAYTTMSLKAVPKFCHPHFYVGL